MGEIVVGESFMMALKHFNYTFHLASNLFEFEQYYTRHALSIDVIVVDYITRKQVMKGILSKQDLPKVIQLDFWGAYQIKDDDVHSSKLDVSQYWTPYPFPPNTFLGIVPFFLIFAQF